MTKLRRSLSYCGPVATLTLAAIGCTPFREAAEASDDGGVTDASDVDARDSVASDAALHDAVADADAEPRTFSIQLATTRYNIVRGEALAIALTLAKSGGFADAVSATVSGLPIGVTADPVHFDVGVTSATLTLHAAANAPFGPRVALSLDAASTGPAGPPLSVKGTAPFSLFVQDPSGTLDTSFGTNGIALVPMGYSTDRIGGEGLSLQPDGKVLLCGVATPTGDAPPPPELTALARLTADGLPDVSFGTNGITLPKAPAGEGHEFCSGIRGLADGHIVISGFTALPKAHGFLAARFNADGSIDPTFGAGTGFFRDYVGGGDSKAFTLEPGADGSVLLGGFAVGSAALLRLNKAGVPDVFGPTAGGATLGIYPGGVVNGMALHTDGRIAISVGLTPGARVYGLSASGVLDASYGVALVGSQVTDTGGQLALQPDDKAVVVTTLPGNAGAASAIQVARLTPSGQLDATFGNAGLATTTIAASDTTSAALTLTWDGRIAVAGSLKGAAAHAFGVLRFTSDGVLDTSFAGAGFVAPAVPAASGAQAITADSEGRILVAGLATDGSRRSGIVVRLWP